MGRVIPLAKPGKDSEQANYRPIALLSPVALLRIFRNINTGFKKKSDNLNCISVYIKAGLNQAKPRQRTLMVALDLTAAFDTIEHNHLLNNIASSNLSNNTKRWILAYLRGRHTYVEFRDTKPKRRKVKQGIPQGGVLPPVLFNLCMSKMPLLESDNIKVTTYADDITLTTPGPNSENLAEN